MTKPIWMRTATIFTPFVLALTAPAVAAPPEDDEPADAASGGELERLLEAELGRPGLTAADVAERAAATSFDAAAKRAELAAAAAEVERALMGYVPRLTVGARYTRLSDPGSTTMNVVAAPDAPPGPLAPGAQLVNAPLDLDSPLNQYTLEAGLVVPLTDYFTRIDANHGAATAAAESADASLAAAERQAAADGRLAYYGWVRARLHVVVAEQALAQTGAHLEDAQRALEVGTASRADVLRVESQVASSELLVESSRSLAEVAEARVRIAMHDDGARALAIGEDVRADLAPMRGRKPTRLWKKALKSRPELVALRAAARAHEEAASAERANYAPRLSLFADAAYAKPAQRAFPQSEGFAWSWDVGASMTWTVSDVPGAVYASRAREQKGAALEAQAKALEDAIRVEVTEAFEDARTADTAIRTSVRGLAAAEESYRVRRTLFQNGMATSAELLDAETDLTRARLDVLDARIDARVARVRLAYAVGDDLSR
jgi:outer membrane protein TolC